MARNSKAKDAKNALNLEFYNNKSDQWHLN